MTKNKFNEPAPKLRIPEYGENRAVICSKDKCIESNCEHVPADGDGVVRVLSTCEKRKWLISRGGDR